MKLPATIEEIVTNLREEFLTILLMVIYFSVLLGVLVALGALVFVIVGWAILWMAPSVAITVLIVGLAAHRILLGWGV